MKEYIPSKNNLLNYEGKRNFVREVFSKNAFTVRKPFYPLFDFDEPLQKVIIASRSVGKTYNLSALALTLCYFKPGIRILMVVPSEQQMRQVLARESINKLIYESEKLLSLLPNEQDRRTVRFKNFKNGSYLHLSYQMVVRGDMDEAAKKIRGTHDDIVIFDEVQDMTEDFIATVLPVLASSRLGFRYFAGTFKTPLHMSYRLYQEGNRIEAAVICPHCNYENIPSVKNIDIERIDEGPICSKCKRVLSRQEIKENMKLLITNPDADYMSLRISSIFAYWLDWKDIVAYKSIMNIEKFISEIVGEPVEQSDILLSEEQIKKVCSNYSNSIKPRPEYLEDYIIVAGIDWQGDHTDTVLTIGGIKNNKLHIFAIKRYVDYEANPQKAHEYVLRDLKPWFPTLVIADWGMGTFRNAYLKEYFILEEVEFHPTEWKYRDNKFVGERPGMLEKMIEAIKKEFIIFPRFEDLRQVKLNMELMNFGIKEARFRGKSEGYLTIDRMDYDIGDDAAMSLLYCFVAYLVITGKIYYPKINNLNTLKSKGQAINDIDKSYFNEIVYELQP
jgi:hypothetical protein